MKFHKKLWIILTCIVLILGAFGYGYYATLGKISKNQPNQKPNNKIDYKYYPTPENEEGVNKIPDEDMVTPSMILERKIKSINTGRELIEYNGVVPDNLVNLTRQEVVDYLKKDYEFVEFSTEKITAVKEIPNLPEHFVVILENKYIVVYKTDSDGLATRYENFEPVPHKNKDERLEKGIEVKTEDDIFKIIGDYE